MRQDAPPSPTGADAAVAGDRPGSAGGKDTCTLICVGQRGAKAYVVGVWQVHAGGNGLTCREFLRLAAWLQQDR